MARQVLAEGGAEPEDGEQPLAQALVAVQRREQRAPVGRGLGESDQRVQRQVGVGGGAERLDQPVRSPGPPSSRAGCDRRRSARSASVNP